MDVKKTDEQTPAPTDLTAFWAEQHEEAKSSGAQHFLFPKEEITRVRLIGTDPNPTNWFRKIKNLYQGKEQTKYLVKGFKITKTERGEIKPEELVAVVLTKTAWANIAAMAREGYDFFSHKGVPIVINRQNNGGRVSYSVMPAPVQVPIPEDTLALSDETPIDFYVEEYKKMQEGRDNKAQAQTQSGPSVADQIINSPPSPNAW